jgi:hypothetical protein
MHSNWDIPTQIVRGGGYQSPPQKGAVKWEWDGNRKECCEFCAKGLGWQDWAPEPPFEFPTHRYCKCFWKEDSEKHPGDDAGGDPPFTQYLCAFSEKELFEDRPPWYDPNWHEDYFHADANPIHTDFLDGAVHLDHMDCPHEDFSDHTDFGHGDWSDHSDVASAHDDFTDHNDGSVTPFSNHYDEAHADSTDHGDSTAHDDWTNHGDASFVNVTTHGNVAFQNYSSHNDVAHNDSSAHSDSPGSAFSNHYQVPFYNNAQHSNYAHGDQSWNHYLHGHGSSEDYGHEHWADGSTSFHYDYGHADFSNYQHIAFVDSTTHSNIAHVDSWAHSDVAHADSSVHADVPFTNTETHSDTPFFDYNGHTNQALHTDWTFHTDQAHLDTISDIDPSSGLPAGAHYVPLDAETTGPNPGISDAIKAQLYSWYRLDSAGLSYLAEEHIVTVDTTGNPYGIIKDRDGNPFIIYYTDILPAHAPLVIPGVVLIRESAGGLWMISSGPPYGHPGHIDSGHTDYSAHSDASTAHQDGTDHDDWSTGIADEHSDVAFVDFTDWLAYLEGI